jgi:hypothetical protein
MDNETQPQEVTNSVRITLIILQIVVAHFWHKTVFYAQSLSQPQRQRSRFFIYWSLFKNEKYYGVITTKQHFKPHNGSTKKSK